MADGLQMLEGSERAGEVKGKYENEIESAVADNVGTRMGEIVSEFQVTGNYSLILLGEHSILNKKERSSGRSQRQEAGEYQRRLSRQQRTIGR